MISTESSSSSDSPVPAHLVSSILLFAAVAAAPFPFGSVDAASSAFWCIWLGLAVVFLSLESFQRRHMGLASLAGLVILGYAFVLHEQLSLHPWLAPSNPLWPKASDALGIGLPPSASIVREQPIIALGPPLANMLAVICSFVVCLNRNRAYQLLLIFAWSGAAYAIYGIAAFLLDPKFVLWHEKIAYADVLTATFINRNTAAAYFGCCSIVWFLFFISQLRRNQNGRPIDWPRLLTVLPSGAFRPIILSFAMLMLSIVAMLLTNSRAGVLISFISLVLAFFALCYRDLPRRGGIAVTIMVGGFCALLLLQVFGGRVVSRFDAEGLSDEGRLNTYRSTIEMIADHPWVGTGLGTFPWAFPAYRSNQASIRGVWDRAHSTPLELTAELGIPLAGLILFAWLWVFVRLIRGVRERRRDQIVPVAGLSVAVLAVAHSSIDFSLQISGFAIPVFGLIGAGLAQSFSNRESQYSQK
jgi:O-antigen ligase